jgi:hypothetical protein
MHEAAIASHRLRGSRDRSWDRSRSQLDQRLDERGLSSRAVASRSAELRIVVAPRLDVDAVHDGPVSVQ